MKFSSRILVFTFNEIVLFSIYYTIHRWATWALDTFEIANKYLLTVSPLSFQLFLILFSLVQTLILIIKLLLLKSLLILYIINDLRCQLVSVLLFLLLWVHYEILGGVHHLAVFARRSFDDVRMLLVRGLVTAVLAYVWLALNSALCDWFDCRCTALKVAVFLLAILSISVSIVETVCWVVAQAKMIISTKTSKSLIMQVWQVTITLMQQGLKLLVRFWHFHTIAVVNLIIIYSFIVIVLSRINYSVSHHTSILLIGIIKITEFFMLFFTNFQKWFRFNLQSIII